MAQEPVAQDTMAQEEPKSPLADPASARAVPVIDRDIFTIAQKRSVTIAGHPTSVRIEAAFWDALLAESDRCAMPLNALIAQIDAARLEADDPPNLASALRIWLFSRAAGPRSNGG